MTKVKPIALGLLALAPLLQAQTITIDPKTQRFVGDISDLDRKKFFTIHTNSLTDSQLNKFYSDYDVVPARSLWGPFAQANNDTKSVGTYPTITPRNQGVRQIREGYVVAEHPRNVIRWNLDRNAAANWAVNYFKNYSTAPVPEFFEPMNEPFVHAGEALYGGPSTQQMKERMADWYGAIGKKIDETPELRNMKVIGYSSAWPQHEHWRGNFSHWRDNQKMFMDRAGAHMDAFSTHLYDGINVNQDGGQRSGSNQDAILDMIEAYSFLKWGVAKPHAITEYGGIASGFNPTTYDPVESVQSVGSINKLLLSFMDRADRMAVAIPFITGKDSWFLNSSRNPNHRPYPPGLFRPTNLNEPRATGWTYTVNLDFYKFWQGVKGKRIDVQSDNIDIQTQAFVDGSKLYLAVNNLDDVTRNVSLNFAKTIPGFQNIRVKRLQVFPNKAHKYTDQTYTSFPTRLTMGVNETALIQFNYSGNITFDGAIRRKTYYANKYLQAIRANTANSFNINGVNAGGTGFASLRLGIGRMHEKSKRPVVRVNGTTVTVPTNWKGYDQASRDSFFGTLDIPVPYALLQTNNTITVTFPDAGGSISSLVLDVSKYDGSSSGGGGNSGNGTPFGGSAKAIPGTIQAEDFNVGAQGLAYNDTTTGSFGGTSYRNTGVDIYEGNATDAARIIGSIADGEYLNYDVNVTPGTFNIIARVASNEANPGDLRVDLDGGSLGTFAIGNTGGWRTFQEVTIPNIILGIGGARDLRLTAVGGRFNIDLIRFETVSSGGGGNNGGGASGNGTSFGGTARAIPGTIQAEDFNVGAQGVAYNDTTSANFGNSTYRNSGVDIYNGNSTEPARIIGSIADGEYLNYDVNVTPGTFNIVARVASNESNPGDLRVDIDGGSLGTFAIGNTGGWRTFQEVTIPNITLGIGGARELRLTAVGGRFNLDFVRFELTNSQDTGDLGQTVQAESFTGQNGIQVVGGTKVGYINNNDWISFSSLGIAGATSFAANVASATSGGTIEIRTGSATGTLLGSVAITNTGGWSTFRDVSTSISAVPNRSNVFLVFKGGSGFLFDVNSFQFGSAANAQSAEGALTVNLRPDADVYIENNTKFDNNVLRVESSGRTRTTYLRFNVSGLTGSTTGATLRLVVPTAANDGAAGTGTIQVYKGTSNPDWTEASITAGNVPAQGSLIGSRTGTFGLNTTHEITLNAAQIPSSGNVTLIVKVNNTQNIAFSSAEGSSAPRLSVTAQ